MTSKPTPRWKTNQFADPQLCAVTEDLLYLVDESLYAVETGTGEIAWETSIPVRARIDATPSYVFIRQPNTATLRCVAAFDGADLWETDVSGRFSYLLANEKNAIIPIETGGGKGLLEAINVDSGKEDWSKSYAAPVGVIASIPEGIIFIDEQSICLINEEVGIERWSCEVDAHIHSYTTHEDRLCIGHASGLMVIDLQTGIERHQLSRDQGIKIIEPVNGGLITGATDGTVSKVRWNGSTEWSTSITDPVTVLAAEDGEVYAGNRAGLVVGLDGDNGKREWKTSVPGTVQKLRKIGTSLCGRVSDGSAIGLDSMSGDHRWRLTVDDSSLSPRFEARGDDMYLYTGSALVCANPLNGSVHWKQKIDEILFGKDWLILSHDGTVTSLPLLPDATTQFIDDRDEDDDSVTHIWRGD